MVLLKGERLSSDIKSAELLVTYEYDPWGKLLGVKDADGSAITSSGHAAIKNPLRYRGYYYDIDSGFYYLQSRYYDPQIGRFINVDNQISNSDLASMNLFAYCGNNPVNRNDPTGEAWWHWAIGAAIVAVCAVATVATCGGFAAAAGAVAGVACGVAASSTAATVAAGALLGSATALGVAALSAAANSNSIREFNDQGNWETVVAIAGGALLGGYSGYKMAKSQQATTKETYTSRGSTGRTAPQNLKEKLAMEQVQADPLNGAKQLPITMTDPRWPAIDGWVKMASNVNGVEIHFLYNTVIHVFDDFKFKG